MKKAVGGEENRQRFSSSAQAVADLGAYKVTPGIRISRPGEVEGNNLGPFVANTDA
jgi:hypothetical protein